MDCRANECGGNVAHCDGQIDKAQEKFISTPCRGLMPIHPCVKCGLLHWAINGTPVYNRIDDYYIFWKDGQIADENGNIVPLDI